MYTCEPELRNSMEILIVIREHRNIQAHKSVASVIKLNEHNRQFRLNFS